MSSLGTIQPGSYRLGTAQDWPTRQADRIAVGHSLRLQAGSGGLRALDAANGTVGGLVGPSTLAVAGPTVLVLDRNRAALRRFDAIANRFCDVPGLGRAATAGHFGSKAGIAATATAIAIADPDLRHLLVLNASTLTITALIPVRDRLVSVAASGGSFFVLDSSGSVMTVSPTFSRVELLGTTPASAGHPSRIIVDRNNAVYVLDVETPSLQRVDRKDQAPITTPSAIADRFNEPAIVVDGRGRFRVPDSLRVTGDGPAPMFDPDGEPARPDNSPGMPEYQPTGRWTSALLDGKALGSRWHRVVLTATMPPGTSLRIRTATSDDANLGSDGPIIASLWSRPHVVSSEPQPRTAPTDQQIDLAVLSDRGRYLAVDLELTGDGWETPEVRELLVEPNRPEIERFLPSTLRADQFADGQLHRFLAMFEREFDRFDQLLVSLPSLFSPSSTPDRWIDVLAAELGLPMERRWSPEQRRKHLTKAPREYPRRGTPAALRAVLRSHLEAANSNEIPEEMPGLIEGYTERTTVEERPRLGAPGLRDSIPLISRGASATDKFAAFAHRFRIFVPRPLLPDADSVDAFERAVESEKPAHVAHTVVLIEPQTVIGVQNCLGISTYLGPSEAVVRLAHGGGPAEPSSGTRRVLGHSPSSRAAKAATGHGAQLGADSILI